MISGSSAAAGESAADVHRRVFGEEPPSFPAGRYPLNFAGMEAGRVSVHDPDTPERTFAAQELLEVLSKILAPDVHARLGQRWRDESVVTSEMLHEVGLDIQFDPSAAGFDLTLPSELRPELRLDAGGARQVRPREPTHEPATISSAVNLRGSLNHAQEAPADTDKGLQGGRLGLDGFLRLSDVVIEGDARFEQDSAQRLRRNDLRATYDLRDVALRLQAGDVRPLARGFQSRRTLLGLRAARDYDMRPDIDVRPQPDRAFELDSQSRVELFVNDVFVRDFVLPPGRFRVEDLPLQGGSANEILLRIEDAFGEIREERFSVFFDARGLEPGRSDFDVAAGFVRSRTAAGLTYDFANPAATGQYRQGVTDTVTLGANLQAQTDRAALGAEGLWAAPIGSFFLEVIGSAASALSPSLSARLSYSFRQPLRGRPARFLRLSAERRGADVVGLGDALQSGADREIYRASLGESLGWGIRGQLDGRYTRQRGGDTYDASLTFHRSFLGGVLSTTLRHQRAQSGPVNSIQLRLSLPLGQATSATGSFDTNRNRLRASVLTRNGSGVGGWRGSATTSRSDGSDSTTASLSYTANRANVSVDHRAAELLQGREARSQRTRLTAGTAMVFADGAFALAPPVTEGFAVFRPGASLSDFEMLIDPSTDPFTETRRLRARSDLLGSPVVSDLAAYRDRTVQLDVPEAPLGSLPDAGQIVLHPPAKSGYLVELGDKARVAVIGTLLDTDGEPLAFAQGRAYREDEEPSTSRGLPFFTNDGGRFYAENLRAGRRYELRLGPERPVYRLDVPEDALGQYRLEAPLIPAALEPRAEGEVP